MNDDESDKKNRNNSTSPLSKDIKQNSKDSDHFLKNNKYEEKQNDMTNKTVDLLNHENHPLKPQQNLKSKLSENYSHKSMKKILTRDILGLNHQSERDKLLLGVSEARLKGLNPNTPSENKLKSSNLNNSPSPFSHLMDNNKLKQSHSQYNSAVFNKNSGMDIKIIQNQSQNLIQSQSQRNQKEKEKENQNQSSDSKLKNSLNIQIIQGQGITSTTNKNNFNSVNQLKYSPVVGLGINYGKTPSKNLSHSTNTKKPENEIKKNINEEIQKQPNEHQELSSRGKEKGLTSSLSKNSILVMGRTNDFKPKSKEHSNKQKSESQNLNPNATPNSNVKFIQKKSTSRPKSANMRFI